MPSLDNPGATVTSDQIAQIQKTLGIVTLAEIQALIAECCQGTVLNNRLTLNGNQITLNGNRLTFTPSNN